MAVSRLGLPRATAATEQLLTRRVDHVARQSEFSWVRRFPAHGVGPCRPGARRSVLPRLLFSRCRARTLLFRSRRYDLITRACANASCQGGRFTRVDRDAALREPHESDDLAGHSDEIDTVVLRSLKDGVENRGLLVEIGIGELIPA